MPKPTSKDMNPKLFIILFAFISYFSFNATTIDCADAYTSASYTLSHSKKAFDAYNFDHQKYYAGRALEALEKTQDLVRECGCEKAIEPIEIGIETLEEAADPTDWKMGRYYSKKAITDTYKILESLDICSMDGESAASSDDNLSDDTSTETESPDTEVDQELRAFANSAQDEIVKLNEKIRELSLMLGCDNAQMIIEKTSTELQDGVQFFSLEEAQEYYRAKSIETYQQAVSALQKCSGKE